MEDAKSRLRRMIGEEGVRTLDAATVVVFGIGGVGSNCAEALVRGGIGSLGFIDGDSVQPSNLNRQAVAYQCTLGQRKVSVMAHLAQAINPDVRVASLDCFVTADSVSSVMAQLPFERIDFIVDAIDTVSAKLGIVRYAQQKDIPVISSMGGANKLDPTQFSFADIYETQVCPLAKSVRKLAREQNLDGFPVLYSRESPHPVRTSEGSARSERTDLGTMSYIPPLMGYMIAGYVIRQILGL